MIRIVVAVCLSTLSLGQRILVDEFELKTELGKFGNPTDLSFLPNGDLLSSSKLGQVKLALRNHYDQATVVLDLSDITCYNGERGMQSVGPHPNFGGDHPYIWVYYAYNKNNNCSEDGENGPVDRLSRFTLLQDEDGTYSSDIQSELVFFDTPPLSFDHHNAGDIAFGKDGYIYITIGDGGTHANAQDSSNLFGTIVRLALDNTIPPTNPFSNVLNSVRCHETGSSVDKSAYCQEIFAYGLRNPFRFAMNPNVEETQFYVNDVGASTWEEISIGGDGYEGANYGWPSREGPCESHKNCTEVENECVVDPDSQAPLHYYHHDTIGEGAVTAGVFVPTGLWPASYDGKYLYADFVYNKLYRMDPTGQDECRDCCRVTSAYQGLELLDFEEGDIVSAEFGPYKDTQALYFLTRGFGGRLNRITYTGGANRDPAAKIVTSALSGPVGTIIEFDGTETTDPDGNALEYEWDLDGNGFVDTSGAVVSFQYNVAGLYTVTMFVRDGVGGEATATVQIGIGEQPSAEILEPPEGIEFQVGQVFVLTGSASGPGISDQDSSMMWEVRQHHSTHYHPFLDPIVGNNLQLQAAPAPEDFTASTNSYLEVILTVTNEFGITTIVSRDIMPKLVEVQFESVPSGLPLLVDDYQIMTPSRVVTWANHRLRFDALDLSEEELVWFKWSNGGDQTQIVTVPLTNTTLLFTATYRSTVPTSSPSTASSTVPTTALSTEPTQTASATPSTSTSPPSDLPTQSPSVSTTAPSTQPTQTLSATPSTAPSLPIDLLGQLPSDLGESSAPSPTSSTTLRPYMSLWLSLHVMALSLVNCG